MQTQNRFQILEDLDNELINDGFYQTRDGNYKKKATSPLDYDLSSKTRKDQITQKPNNENSDSSCTDDICIASVPEFDRNVFIARKVNMT